MLIIIGCGRGGGGGGGSDNSTEDTTNNDGNNKIPSEYTKGDITVSFLEASHKAIAKLDDADVSLKAYKYKEQKAMTESDLSALKSKLDDYLGTRFAEDATTRALSYDQPSNHRNANVLFKSPDSEADEQQALKINPYSKGIVYHRSQVKYLMSEKRLENSGSRTKAALTRGNAPEFALACLKDMDLMPQEQYSKLKVGKVSGIGINGEDSPRIFTVYFIRELSGFPVVGNTRIVVSMTAGGKLISLIHKWPELEATVNRGDAGIGNSNVVRGSDAVDRIGDLLNNYHNETKVDSIDVRRTKLVMYDDGKHVEPVLFASGDISTKSGDTIEQDWIIPVLKITKGKYEVRSDYSQPEETLTSVSEPIPDPENSDSQNVE
jgi:hypothetical protein